MRRSTKLTLLLLISSVFIYFVSIGGCSSNGGGGDNPLARADIVRGGLLYDKWWAVTGADEPESTNPTYPTEQNAMFSMPPRSGSQTWRCKECHAWDYLGDEGFYAAPSSHFTGVEGVLQVSNLVFAQTRGIFSPEELFEIIANGHGATDYGALLADDDIWDLVKFLLDGQIDDRLIVDYDSPDMNEIFPPVDLDNGADIYNVVCADCHGIDGEGLEADGTEGISLHEVALDNPVEFLHKIRWGQPGTDMPSLVDLGFNIADQKDVLAYAQDVLPNTEPPPPGEGCCVFGPEDCEDGLGIEGCADDGGEFQAGVMCDAVPECSVVPPPLDGALLYMDNCETCHGPNGDGSGSTGVPVVGATSQEIIDANMQFGLTLEEVDAIADFLAAP